MSDVDLPGYELAPTLELDTPERLRAVADPIRALIIDLVLEGALSVTELAERVGRSKGTVAHHVDLLVEVGLLQVVRTRKVRAMEERFYGRTARTFNFPTDPEDQLPFAADAMREWDRSRQHGDEVGGFTLRHARIPAERAHEFWTRLEELALEFTRAPRGGDVEYAVYLGLFPTNRPVAPTRKKAARRAS